MSNVYCFCKRKMLICMFIYIYECMLNHFIWVQLFVPLWTVARQPLLSVGFSRQENWSGLPYSPRGDLSDPGVKPASLTCPALTDGLLTTSATWEASCLYTLLLLLLLSHFSRV